MKNDRYISRVDLLDEERINSFLRGEMSSEEETLFIDELKSNEELRNKAVATARMAKAMKTVGEENDSLVKEALLASDEHDIEMIVNNVTRKRSKVLTLRILSVAASILILVISGWHYYDYRVTTGLGNEYEMEIESLSFVRGAGTGSVNKELNSLLDPFAQESENRKAPAPKEVQEEQRRQIEQNQIIANQQQEAQYQANKERMQQVKKEVNTKAAEKALEAESYVMLSFDNIHKNSKKLSQTA